MKTLRVQLVIGSLLFLAMGLLLFGGAVPVFASIGLEGRWTNLAPSVIGLSVGGYMFPVTLVAGLGIRRQKQRREERPAAPSHP